MNCKDLNELLSAYADGELGSTQKDFIETHLQGCADCRATLADYMKTGEQLLSLRTTPAMPDVREVTVSRISAHETPEGLRRWLRPALVTASILLILGVVLPLQLSGSPDASSTMIAKAYAATAELESYKYTTEEYTPYGESGIPVHHYLREVEYTAPDRYRMIAEFPYNYELTNGYPDRVRMIRIGDQVYTPFLPLIKTDPKWFKQMTPTKDKTMDMLNLLGRTETLEDESIDSTECYHHKGEVDIEKYLEWIRPTIESSYYKMEKNLPAGVTIDLELYIKSMNSAYRATYTDMTFEFWIGKDDYILRKAILVHQTKKGETFTGNSLNQIIYYSNFNEEIIIEPPLDESGEVLEGWYVYTLEE